MNARHRTRAASAPVHSPTSHRRTVLGQAIRPDLEVAEAPPMRLKLAVRGAVQGVGFRPFVFRLASELGLTGWVNNSSQGVFIEVEGSRPQLETFRLRLETYGAA